MYAQDARCIKEALWWSHKLGGMNFIIHEYVDYFLLSIIMNRMIPLTNDHNFSY